MKCSKNISKGKSSKLRSSRRRYSYLIFIPIIAGLVIITYLLQGGFEGAPILNTLYLEPRCNCCERYADYLKTHGIPLRKEYRDGRELGNIKAKYGIPRDMWSCHTTIIGAKFFEGHIPIEAIKKAIEERPDIAGIALPGMPAGSPGMPGTKTQPFRIYAIAPNGEISIFVEV